MKTLLKFEPPLPDPNNKVINQWVTDRAPNSEPDLFDATGRSDGPDYMGRTYDRGADTFSTLPTPTKTRRELLKEQDKTTWTTEDIAEALQELL